MFALVLLATTPLLPVVDGPGRPEAEAPGQALFAPFDDRAALRPLPELEELSKKEQWLTDKARRLDVHLSDRDLNRERREKAHPRRPSIDIKGNGHRRGRKPARRSRRHPGCAADNPVQPAHARGPAA